MVNLLCILLATVLAGLVDTCCMLLRFFHHCNLIGTREISCCLTKSCAFVCLVVYDVKQGMLSQH